MTGFIFTPTGILCHDVSPDTRLAAAIIYRALRDTKAGNLEALAWLVSSGADMAELLSGAGREIVMSFCHQIAGQIERGELAAAWGYNNEGGYNEPR